MKIFSSDIFQHDVVGIYQRDEDIVALIKVSEGDFRSFIIDIVNEPHVNIPGIKLIVDKLSALNGTLLFVNKAEMITYFFEDENISVNLKRVFMSTNTGDACVSPNLAPYDLIKYYNGSGSYPVVGDTIYEDFQGSTPAADIGTGSKHKQMLNGAYVLTDANGVMTAIVCPQLGL